MAFSDWSTDAASNTSVGSVGIGEGCPPGNLNNMGREMMAELRAAFSSALDAFFAAGDLHSARAALKALGSEGSEQVTGEILHNGGGAYLYYTTSGLNSGRVFVTTAGTPDPTSLAGDLWITY